MATARWQSSSGIRPVASNLRHPSCAILMHPVSAILMHPSFLNIPGRAARDTSDIRPERHRRRHPVEGRQITRSGGLKTKTLSMCIVRIMRMLFPASSLTHPEITYPWSNRIQSDHVDMGRGNAQHLFLNRHLHVTARLRPKTTGTWCCTSRPSLKWNGLRERRYAGAGFEATSPSSCLHPDDGRDRISME